MKKFLKFAASLAAMFMVLSCFVACGGGGPSASVDTPAIEDVEKSGATKVVASDEDVQAVIASIMTDPVIDEIANLIKDLDLGDLGDMIPSFSKVGNRQAYDKADVKKLEEILNGYSEQIEKFSTDIAKEGKGSLSIDDTIAEVDLGDDLNKWLSIKDVVLKINADVDVDIDETKGTGDVDVDADAEVAAKTEIKVKELAKDSGFGTVKCNVAVGADGDVSASMTEEGEDISGKISASVAVAVAFPYVDSTGLGGRFLITLDADASAKLEEAMKLEKEDEIMSYVKDNCDVELVIKVFDDEGKESYTKEMNLEDILKLVEGEAE